VGESRACTKSQPEFGTVSTEARQRAGEKLKGRQFSPDHRRRISEAKTGMKRPDIAERNSRSGEWLRGRKLVISKQERQRRREAGKLAVANLRNWQSITDKEKDAISNEARIKMKKVWSQRTQEQRDEIVNAIRRTKFERKRDRTAHSDRHGSA
jgi:hypothetical protein